MVGHNVAALIVDRAVIGMDHGAAHQDVVQGALATAPLERVLHAVLLKRHHLHRDLRILQPTLLHDQPNAADARLQAVGAPLQQIVVAEGPGRRVARPVSCRARKSMSCVTQKLFSGLVYTSESCFSIVFKASIIVVMRFLKARFTWMSE